MLIGVGLVLFASGLSLLARLYYLPPSLDQVFGTNATGLVLLVAGILALVRALLPIRQPQAPGTVRGRSGGRP
jgi:hypothetical protein